MKPERKVKVWIVWFILMAIMPVFVVTGLLYVYDPMMQLHKPWGRDVHLHSNMRLQAAGIIRNSGKSSYILGTSMLENSSADRASEIIGGDFANISISGGNFYERSFPLRLALDEGAKHIIYSLGSYYLSRPTGRDKYPEENYIYLYQDGISRIRLYFQHKYFRCMIEWSEHPSCVGSNENYDMPNAWVKKPGNSRRFGGLDNWFSAQNSRQVINALNGIVKVAESINDGKYFVANKDDLEVEIKEAINYVDRYVIDYARKYTSTNFELIFPPYSRIRFAEWHQLKGTHAKVHEAVVRYVAKSASELKNINVYGYEDQGFLDDISNYKDTGHYDQWVNEMFTENIARGENRITLDNVEDYLDAARVRALNFDLIGLGDKINQHLNEM